MLSPSKLPRSVNPRRPPTLSSDEFVIAKVAFLCSIAAAPRVRQFQKVNVELNMVDESPQAAVQLNSGSTVPLIEVRHPLENRFIGEGVASCCSSIAALETEKSWERMLVNDVALRTTWN